MDISDEQLKYLLSLMAGYRDFLVRKAIAELYMIISAGAALGGILSLLKLSFLEQVISILALLTLLWLGGTIILHAVPPPLRKPRAFPHALLWFGISVSIMATMVLAIVCSFPPWFFPVLISAHVSTGHVINMILSRGAPVDHEYLYYAILSLLCVPPAISSPGPFPVYMISLSIATLAFALYLVKTANKVFRE